MIEAVESTFNLLGHRTKIMSETVDRVEKKYNKSHNDFKHLLEVLKEMRVETQELLKRQDRIAKDYNCLLYTSPSPRDKRQSRMPSSA